MSGHVRWVDIRAEHVARAGGEEAVEAGKQELLAVAMGHRHAGPAEQHVTERRAAAGRGD
jgi:hypothetical protein